MRIGFVGCGLIAASHALNLAAVDGAEIVAVHDADGERARGFAERFAVGPSAIVASAGEVIAASDAVYVCTWTSAHPEIVLAAAEAGRAVFCEKPLAVDLATAEAMTAAVTEAGVVNQVGLVLRNSPAFRWLHHRTTAGDLGPLMTIVFRDDQYLPTQGMYGSTWRADRDKAGAGTLLEHSIHDLDLLHWLMGPITSVSAHLGYRHGLEGIDDHATVLLEAASGAQAALVSVWHDVLSRPSQRRVEVFCQGAVTTLEGDWSGPVVVETGPEPPESGGPASGPGRLEGKALAAAAAEADGLGTNPDAAFVAAVEHGRSAYPDFAIALAAHRLADAAYRSGADDGRPVPL